MISPVCWARLSWFRRPKSGLQNSHEFILPGYLMYLGGGSLLDKCLLANLWLLSLVFISRECMKCTLIAFCNPFLRTPSRWMRGGACRRYLFMWVILSVLCPGTLHLWSVSLSLVLPVRCVQCLIRPFQHAVRRVAVSWFFLRTLFAP